MTNTHVTVALQQSKTWARKGSMRSRAVPSQPEPLSTKLATQCNRESRAVVPHRSLSLAPHVNVTLILQRATRRWTGIFFVDLVFESIVYLSVRHENAFSLLPGGLLFVREVVRTYANVLALRNEPEAQVAARNSLTSVPPSAD